MVPINELEHGPALVRALRSLTAADVDRVACLVTQAAPDWSLESFDDYDGFRLMLVEPRAELAADRPSFLISGKIGEIDLTLLESENSIPIRRFAEIQTLVDMLARFLDVSVAA